MAQIQPNQHRIMPEVSGRVSFKSELFIADTNTMQTNEKPNTSFQLFSG